MQLFCVSSHAILAFRFSFDVSTFSLASPVKANPGAVVFGKTKETTPLVGELDLLR